MMRAVGVRGCMACHTLPCTAFLLASNCSLQPLLACNPQRTVCSQSALTLTGKLQAPRKPFSRLFGGETANSWPFERCRTRSVFACRAEKQESGIQDAVSVDPIKSESQDILQGWQRVGLYLFGLGFVLGPPLDGIHSRVQLQIYDKGAIDIAGLHTNIWVFPMLGVFYSVVGVLQLVLDNWLAPKGRMPTASLKRVGLSLISLALLLELSAELYKAGVPYNVEAYTLFAFAELNWVLFDNTWWGFALASIVGVACPLAEVPITNMATRLFGLWHYPKGNLELFGESTVSWVIACYFIYTPFISNLSRWLSSLVHKQATKSVNK